MESWRRRNRSTKLICLAKNNSTLGTVKSSTSNLQKASPSLSLHSYHMQPDLTKPNSKVRQWLYHEKNQEFIYHPDTFSCPQR